jgi:hypothetical protein
VEFSIPNTYQNALTLLCARLPVESISWALTGSLGHRLQGVDVSVHDIDIQIAEADIWKVADLLAEYQVIEPYRRNSERMSSIFGTLEINGILVELMGGIRKRVAPGHAWGPPTDPAAFRVFRRFGELHVPVMSLPYEVSAYEQIGRPERAAQLRAALIQQEAWPTQPDGASE